MRTIISALICLIAFPVFAVDFTVNVGNDRYYYSTENSISFGNSTAEGTIASSALVNGAIFMPPASELEWKMAGALNTPPTGGPYTVSVFLNCVGTLASGGGNRMMTFNISGQNGLNKAPFEITGRMVRYSNGSAGNKVSAWTFLSNGAANISGNPIFVDRQNTGGCNIADNGYLELSGKLGGAANSKFNIYLEQ